MTSNLILNLLENISDVKSLNPEQTYKEISVKFTRHSVLKFPYMLINRVIFLIPGIMTGSEEHMTFPGLTVTVCLAKMCRFTLSFGLRCLCEIILHLRMSPRLCGHCPELLMQQWRCGVLKSNISCCCGKLHRALIAW